MECLVLVIQAIICVTSCVIADYTVTHRKGLAKRLIIGQDTPAVISEMRGLALATFFGMKADTKLKDYTITTTVENEKNTKVVVETEKTIVIYTEKEGDTVTNKGFTESRAILNEMLLYLFGMDIILVLGILCFMN